MKIYTRTGDSGETGLWGGKRVSKHDLAIELCGDLDETNCWIGLARSQVLAPAIDAVLHGVQQELFAIGARVAGWDATEVESGSREAIQQLEREIDRLTEIPAPLTHFILPGGSPAGASLHLARSVCRKAERRLVELRSTWAPQNKLAVELIYLNRLSDLLFTMARAENHRRQCPESKWTAH